MGWSGGEAGGEVGEPHEEGNDGAFLEGWAGEVGEEGGGEVFGEGEEVEGGGFGVVCRGKRGGDVGGGGGGAGGGSELFDLKGEGADFGDCGQEVWAEDFGVVGEGAGGGVVRGGYWWSEGKRVFEDGWGEGGRGAEEVDVPAESFQISGELLLGVELAQSAEVRSCAFDVVAVCFVGREKQDGKYQMITVRSTSLEDLFSQLAQGDIRMPLCAGMRVMHGCHPHDYCRKEGVGEKIIVHHRSYHECFLGVADPATTSARCGGLKSVLGPNPVEVLDGGERIGVKHI